MNRMSAIALQASGFLLLFFSLGSVAVAEAHMPAPGDGCKFTAKPNRRNCTDTATQCTPFNDCSETFSCTCESITGFCDCT